MAAVGSSVQTQHHVGVIDAELATTAYDYLRHNIRWQDGVRTSQGGFTRKACPLQIGGDPVVDNLLILALQALNLLSSPIFGLYLNWYRDGNDYTPMHRHRGARQLIISLGGPRVLRLGRKDYQLESGDIILFGQSAHGIKRDPTCVTGRISIAVFLNLP